MSQPDNREILARMRQFNEQYQDVEPPTIPLSACISGTALDETSVDLAGQILGSYSSQIPVVLLNDKAKMPTKAHTSDAGWDLYAANSTIISEHQRKTIETGIALEIPNGYVGLIWPRSGLSVKQGIDVLAGVVDSGYRGEIKVCLYNTSKDNVVIESGDRIAQILIQPVSQMEMMAVDSLSDTERGEGGFGSSGV